MDGLGWATVCDLKVNSGTNVPDGTEAKRGPCRIIV